MPFFRLLPAVLALLVLAAHFYRAGLVFLVPVSLGLVLLMAVRFAWVPRVITGVAAHAAGARRGPARGGRALAAPGRHPRQRPRADPGGGVAAAFGRRQALVRGRKGLRPCRVAASRGGPAVAIAGGSQHDVRHLPAGDRCMQAFNDWMVWLNGILWHNIVLYIVLATGILFTIWSKFGQATALTHGWKVIRGQYDDPADPGAINHFQALSAALSATVGLGNIGGVALALALGGPGAVFWMWVVGFFGMAVKMTEVTLSMLYRNTDDPDNPHGGPMWVVKQGIARMNPSYAWLGSLIGTIFCLTLLVSTVTGGNMFQAWNVGEITEAYFGIPSVLCGIVLSILVGLVIIGGIKRIGNVAGHLVPVMLALYVLGGLYVLAVNVDQIPAMIGLIFKGAFSPTEAGGAFIGGTAGYAFLFGMKRALFSNEAGQGSSPIAHSAAKTDEPVREGVVAGLEPFIDTLIICTFTALVILSTGVWNRGPDATYAQLPEVQQVSEGVWTLETRKPPILGKERWNDGDPVYTLVHAHDNPNTANDRHRINGVVHIVNGETLIEWGTLESPVKPELVDPGIYAPRRASASGW